MTISHIKTTENFTLENKAVELKGIGKKYPFSGVSFWALTELSVSIGRGEVVGIIGRNGAGKTTLLNIIAGIISPTQGEVIIKGQAKGLFNLGVGFQEESTGRENIFLNGAILGASKKELEGKMNSIIEFSELANFIDAPLGTYSQGMRLRLGFSIITNIDFDILVIDEILAVGDILFQNKCFQKLMDFKRQGKTLIITNQNMDLIERLCDKVLLLDHGKLIYQGDVLEGVNKYRQLLVSQKFFVGPAQTSVDLVENTKKWADDIDNWGSDLGTKEVEIEKVELLNSFGFRCSKIKSGHALKIKVSFKAKNKIKEPHFGVAILRNDGVYVYGPNSKNDGYIVQELIPGKGMFLLDFPKLLLAPGEYRISVAIWDKKETVAFNYRSGFYKLTVVGANNPDNQLVNLKFNYESGNIAAHYNCRDSQNSINKAVFDNLVSVKMWDSKGEEKSVFMTNESFCLKLNFKEKKGALKDLLLWARIYRDDGVYCQGIPIYLSKKKHSQLYFPRFPFLPGGYQISLTDKSKVQNDSTDLCKIKFNMVFNRQDHGTVYLEHKWVFRGRVYAR